MSSVVLREWDACAEACAKAGFRVLLPNFHSNPRTAPGLVLGVGEEDVMKILATAISAHSKEPVILMGKSWGGAVAAKFAQRHSDMVRQLVLVCPALSSAAVAKAAFKLKHADTTIVSGGYATDMRGNVKTKLLQSPWYEIVHMPFLILLATFTVGSELTFC